MIEHLPKDVLEDTSGFKHKSLEMVESMIPVILHVYIRFGKWEEILGEPFEPYLKVSDIFKDEYIYASTIASLYYARGIAYSVLAGKTDTKEKSDELLAKADQCRKDFKEAY